MIIPTNSYFDRCFKLRQTTTPNNTTTVQAITDGVITGLTDDGSANAVTNRSAQAVTDDAVTGPLGEVLVDQLPASYMQPDVCDPGVVASLHGDNDALQWVVVCGKRSDTVSCMGKA